MKTLNIQNQSLLGDLFQETINTQTKNVVNTDHFNIIKMETKWDTCSSCKVPPFDVLHHIQLFSWHAVFIRLHLTTKTCGGQLKSRILQLKSSSYPEDNQNFTAKSKFFSMLVCSNLTKPLLLNISVILHKFAALTPLVGHKKVACGSIQVTKTLPENQKLQSGCSWDKLF